MRIYDEIDDGNIIVEEYFRKLLVRYLLGCRNSNLPNRNALSFLVDH
jgi:hypothetical protein